MGKTVVMTDSTVDLSKELIEKYDIEIIPLETREETMFSRNLHIISCKEGILLCPGGGDTFRPIMLFDRQGKYMRYIGSLGQGPEEMLIHPSIGYDEEKQEVIVPDWVDLKVYGIDGKFKRRLFKYKEDDEYYVTLVLEPDGENAVYDLRRCGLEYAEELMMNAPEQTHIEETAKCIIKEDALLHLKDMIAK